MTESSEQNPQEGFVNIRKEDSFTAVCIGGKGKVVPTLNYAVHLKTEEERRYSSMHS
jgi:hypothetical protein